ncbi:MAG: protein translocase subunit SecDF [Bacteroidales bacterium]|jgi:SecD/SecF fusion protein|nr:protein translocase subunit SecDF [Bacteroidales bacterium]
MKNKGLFLFFSIVLAITCFYCLSFSFVSWKISKDAERYANDPAVIENELQNITDPMLKNHIRDSVISERTSQYLKDINDKKVFLGFTYRQVKYKEINLGLDLKGGMNVTLEVSYPDVLKSLANNTEDSLFANAFNKANIEYEQSRADYIDIFIKNFEAEKIARNMTNAQLRTYFDRYGSKNAPDAEIKNFLNKESNEIIDRTFRILRTRIDRFGVAQPNIQRLQGSRILVELPGIKEPERVTELLKSTAKLEFWEVYNDPVNGRSIHDRFYEADQKLVVELHAIKDLAAKKAEKNLATTDTTEISVFETNGGEEITGILARAEKMDNVAIAYFKESKMKEIDQLLPEIIKYIGDKSIVFMWGKPITENGIQLYPLIPLKRNNDRIGPKLSAETIGGARVVRTARQDINHENQVVVSMAMESQAADKWREITKTAMDNQSKTTFIAIVLDNFVYSYPRIVNEIPNGESVITGQFSIEEAKDLATVLNSGNLEARVNIVQSEVVGPTLGQESINSGLLSFLLAFILVLLYMYFYYGRAGLVADIALFTNIFFIMGVLASLGAALTLPGIAGIVLTLGMAVDANVLIFERIREEVRAGKGARLAIDEGYKNAYSAIIDGNVTTLITGIVLYIFGSGPIQGFATTLIIGILSSLFTAIFVSRLIFDRGVINGVNYKFGNKYTLHFFENAKFDFIGKKKTFYGLSIILTIIVSISFFTLKLNPGIDFTGGRNYVVRFDQEVKTNEVRDAISNAFGGNPEVKTFGGKDQVRITTNYKIESNEDKVDEEVGEMLYEALKGFFAKADITLEDFTQQVDPRGIQSTQKVQSTVAKELLMQAVWAVLISLLLIFIYIALRFRNWQFGLGGVIALAHDAMLTIGLFSLFYKVMPFSMEIDQSFIAAILTVIGYSINNVVVIYDRVRENFGLYPKRDNMVNINNAVNSVLGRTVNTAGTTIIVLLAIFIFGGEVIRGFVFAMGAGIIIGTYSGIFVSSPLIYDLLNRAKKIKRTKVELLK